MTDRSHPRYSNEFWRQCYTAALTGMTMAGAVRLSAHGAAEPEPSSSPESPSTALAQPTSQALAVPGPEVATPAPGPDVDPYHAALVAEAIKIADASVHFIVGPITERRGPAPPGHAPERYAANAVGNVKTYKVS